RNMVKLFSSYAWRSNLNTGISFYFQTGRPITPLTDGDFGAFPISPRGTLGRTDSIASVDVHASYNIRVLRSQQITLGMDVFNLFNLHGVTAVDGIAENYYDHPLQPIQDNRTFLDPIDNQPPRSIRFLLRYSF
ncbi:MAG TPA: hypothetical protein VLR94_06050, partial [Acidobacteriota bacterium]|nr:hypothetical protein [Acidobacteriota bacterium]